MKEYDVVKENEQEYNEIQLVKMLSSHPNICKYLHHEQKGMKYRLYMTKYSCSLKDHIENYKSNNPTHKFSSYTIVEYSLQIVLGMKYLHELNIIHRDLKPDNIFINFDEHHEMKKIVIGDFDASRYLEPDNQARTVVGTLHFMAPEVMKAGADEGYSKHIDIWSFGMILYELITFQTPFIGYSALEIFELVTMKIKPEIVEDHWYDMFPLIDLYEQCTSFEPSERPNAKTIKKLLTRM
eukprot:TRINITY_DN5911_c0_g1_i3.p1 TRINITY_DN5911_c0_g1~~TRINITY_DN5911_c0_g1_i3.p1  ORF type:complete len:239 (+),score=39.52 TRINITY_DN5911_c0_g1_i3:147-863(+)